MRAGRRGGRRPAQSADDIVALVEDLARRTHVFGALDTLENLKKGGRIGGAQAMLGSMLSIKPIIDISTGDGRGGGQGAHPHARRSTWLRDKVAEAGAVEHLAVMPRRRPRRRRVARPARAGLPRATRSSVGHIGPVIGTHGGPRVMGVTWLDPA